MARTFIYALVDPRTDQVRYVGKADQPARRHETHCKALRSQRDDCHRTRWLAGLRAEGLKPDLIILERVRVEEWPERERYWIARLRDLGAPLTNVHPGGKGGRAPWTPEQRARGNPKNSERMRGRPNPAHAERQRGRVLSAEHRDAISRALAGRTLTEEHAANIAASLKASPKVRGTRHAEETKQQIAASCRARLATIEGHYEPRGCPTCGASFEALVGRPGPSQRYCKTECRPSETSRRVAAAA